MLEQDASKVIDAKQYQRKKNPLLRDLKYNWVLYLMVLPTIIYFLVFSYLPIYGVSLAFRKFVPGDGIFDVVWVGFDNFRELLFSVRRMFFTRAFRNSLNISFLKLVIGFPVPVVISLLINELRHKTYKKLVQTSTFLPYFMSWVVVGSLVSTILSPSGGIINGIMKTMGQEPINFLASNTYFVWVLVFSDIWKGAGFAVVIYLGAISSIDTQLYEAAVVDGCNRLHRIRYITLPGIYTTMAILLILSARGIMYAGFEQVFVMYSPSVYVTGDIIDTYIYRTGVSQGKYDIATAASLLQSVIGLVLLLVVNKVASKISQGEAGLL